MIAIGPDRFFDPGRLAIRGGAHVFSPAAIDDDPQELSGSKLTHAIGYANTSFFYFAEANPAAPITVGQSDKLLPGGWFVGPPEEKVRIVETKKDGKTWHTVSVNSRLSSRSREVITSTVLIELQKHLAVKDHGKVNENDMLKGLILVGGYLDLFCPYSDTINEVLDGFSKTYGFTGVTYETYYEAAKKDGHDGTASAAALSSLRQHGVTARTAPLRTRTRRLSLALLTDAHQRCADPQALSAAAAKAVSPSARRAASRSAPTAACPPRRPR